MKNLTPELIAKAKAAKSAEELLALANENNVELTEEEAKTYFEQLNANGTVSDDELDAVAGGGRCPGDDGDDADSTTSSDCSAITGRCFQCGGTEIVFQMYFGDKIYKCKKCNSMNVKVPINKRLF